MRHRAPPPASTVGSGSTGSLTSSAALSGEVLGTAVSASGIIAGSTGIIVGSTSGGIGVGSNSGAVGVGSGEVGSVSADGKPNPFASFSTKSRASFSTNVEFGKGVLSTPQYATPAAVSMPYASSIVKAQSEKW